MAVEGWEKGGRSVGLARQCPPFTHARGMKDGKKVVKEWDRQRKPTLHPCKEYEACPLLSPAPPPSKKHPLTNERVSHHAILNIQKSADFFFIKQVADKEGAEFAVAGADFIEAHFVDEFLELKNIVSE